MNLSEATSKAGLPDDVRLSIIEHIDEIGRHVHGYRIPAMLAYASALAGQNMCIIGAPGEGKSMFARAMADAFDLGAPHFEWTLARTTTPDEIYGPISLSAYEAGRLERETTGKLPAAGTAFLDEVFKGSSAVLNSLLTMLNERTFDGSPVPLRFIISASNELPDGWRQGRNGVPVSTASDDLGALWDRYTVRIIHDDQPTGGDLSAILRSSSSSRPALPSVPLTDALLSDATRAIDSICSATDPDFFVSFLNRLEAPRGKSGRTLKLSTRRKRNVWRLCGALAIMTGSEEINEEHVLNAWPALWSTQDQIEDAQASAEFLMPPAYVEISDLAGQIDKMAKEYCELHEDNIERYKIGQNVSKATKELQALALKTIPSLPAGLRASVESMVEAAAVQMAAITRAAFG